MEPYQEKAWEMLTPNEQNSLFLSISQGLSTKKTGEIMKISHYKYLELKARSERLFKLFSEYFQVHPSLIRPRNILEEPFKYYLEACIEKRLPKSEAIEYAGEESWLLTPVSTKCIIRNMNNLKLSEDPWDKDLYALIQEFDRWNNFRILPLSLQTSSPYKRRETKKYIIYFRYLKSIPYNTVSYLINKYHKVGINRNYSVMFSEKFQGGFLLISLKKSSKVTEVFTSKRLYVFEDINLAREFALMISNYENQSISPKSGLHFWKKFKELITYALNYKEIDNHDFNYNFLDHVYNISRSKTPRKKDKI